MNPKPNMAHGKTPSAQLPVQERIRSFEEVDLGYTAEQAMQEAQRCLDCPDRWCSQHCPAHNYIPEFIAEVRRGDFQAAWKLLLLTNPLMEISGRVCPFEQQCESHCTRGIKCEPVAIGKLERFVADWYRRQMQESSPKPRRNGKCVAVVGAGPAGLTCALSLANAGFAVTVYEKRDKPGGVPVWGIPGFALPEGIMGRLFSELEEQGAKLVLNTELGKDITLAQLREENDAVFLATGAEKPTELSVPGAELAVQARDFLQDNASAVSGSVLVFGGGNTAIDAARTALRRGASSVSIVYRRTVSDMPATASEIALAREEGIGFTELTSPVGFERNGDGLTVVCDAMELSAPDYPGGRNNAVPLGKKIRLDCQTAVLALGFENVPTEGVSCDARGRILVGKDYSTDIPKVYAGGDAVTGAATLMKAVAAGKDAAAAIFSRPE